MYAIRNATIAFVLIACNLHAQTVVQNSNLTFSSRIGDPDANYSFTVYQDAAGVDPTTALFSMQVNFHNPITNPTITTDISLINLNIDEGSDWYVVKPGDQFGPSTIAAGQFPKLFSVYPWIPPPGPTITVGFEDEDTYRNTGGALQDFYLGVSTGRGFSSTIAGKPNRTVYGWVRVHPLPFPNLGVLQMVENVVSYNSPGIVVGTTTLVPEPSAIAISFCAIACCLSGRFRRD